jgi:hypothetical protein
MTTTADLTVEVGRTTVDLDVQLGTATAALDVSVGAITADLAVSVGGATVGPPGPPGPAGDSSFVFTQDVAATIWAITHNLNRFPSLTLVDTAGDEMETDFRYIDSNNIEVIFNIASTGIAYLN